MLQAVRFALNHLLNVVHGKDLKSHGEVVGIKQELRHILELEDMGKLEPLEQQDEGARHGLGSDLSAPQLVHVRI